MSRARSALWLVALVALALRLWVAYAWVGTTDVRRWEFFAALIEQGRVPRLYVNTIPLWNHPAPMIFLLRLVSWTQDVFGWPFYFAFKLWPVMADVAAGLVLHVLARRSHPPRVALLLAASYLLSPLTVLISAYHGNTDPILVLALLGAVVLLPERPMLSALALGAAVSTKYAALLVFPAFLSSLPGPRAMLRYLAVSLTPIALLSAPTAWRVPRRFVSNILGYSSSPEAWGLAHLRALAELGSLGEMGRRQGLLPAVDFLLAHAKVLIVGLVLLFALLNWCRQRLDLASAVTLAFACFLALTPGFGVQYAIWLLPFFLVSALRLGSIYHLAAGIFVANAYYTGSAHFGGMKDPDVHVTPFALIAWGAVLAYLWQGARRLFSSATAHPDPSG